MSGTRRFSSHQSSPASNGYWRDPSDHKRVSGPVQRIAIGLMITLTIVFTAMSGYMLAGWSWSDALYMVVITIFGIGYDETQPVNTPVLRTLTIFLILSGYVSIIYTVGGFAQILVDGEIRKLLKERKMQREIEQLHDHVIICGFGRMGSKLAETLAKRGKKLLVIEMDSARAEHARECGCIAIHGNATEEQTLRAAGIDRAGILTTVLSDDVANLFITITARELNPKLEILARAEEPSTIKKLKQVGANRIVLPAVIGADRLANLILRPSAETIIQDAEIPQGLNDDLASLGLRFDELLIQRGSALIGGSITDLRVHSNNACLIVALRTTDGAVVLNPTPDLRLSQGDCVVILAHDSDIAQLCRSYALQSEMKEADSASLSSETSNSTTATEPADAEKNAIRHSASHRR